jgi:hypothetical protein
MDFVVHTVVNNQHYDTLTTADLHWRISMGR